MSYDQDLSRWNQNGMGADIMGQAQGDWAGMSVLLSHHGRIVAVGSLKNDGNGEEAGRA